MNGDADTVSAILAAVPGLADADKCRKGLKAAYEAFLSGMDAIASQYEGENRILEGWEFFSVRHRMKRIVEGAQSAGSVSGEVDSFEVAVTRAFDLGIRPIGDVKWDVVNFFRESNVPYHQHERFQQFEDAGPFEAGYRTALYEIDALLDACRCNFRREGTEQNIRTAFKGTLGDFPDFPLLERASVNDRLSALFDLAVGGCGRKADSYGHIARLKAVVAAMGPEKDIHEAVSAGYGHNVDWTPKRWSDSLPKQKIA